MRILLSRTDSIGDVILTLPVAGVLKEAFPGCHIIFLGKDYTRPIVEACDHVDAFVDWNQVRALAPDRQVEAFRQLAADVVIHVFPVRDIAVLAKKAGIAKRIGSTGRLYHWFTCNLRVPMSRRRSDLHESQLNLLLLKPLGIFHPVPLKALYTYYGFSTGKLPAVPGFGLPKSGDSRKTVILHPRSKGSAREWGLDNFRALIDLLIKADFRICITGTREEGESIRPSGILDTKGVEDLTGRLTLPEFMAFIGKADVLVAASTGPLHIAAALGVKAIGLYPPIRPMHPGRWAPIGQDAHYLVKNGDCSDCRKIEVAGTCACITGISPEAVLKKILH